MDRAEAQARVESPPIDDADASLELERARARLQESLGALHTRIDEWRDWRVWLRRHPWPFLMGAVGLGMLVGWRRRDD